MQRAFRFLQIVELAFAFFFETAALDEGENLRELTGVEPHAVGFADVDDDAGDSAELLSIHAFFANRAHEVVDLGLAFGVAFRQRETKRGRVIARRDDSVHHLDVEHEAAARIAFGRAKVGVTARRQISGNAARAFHAGFFG